MYATLDAYNIVGPQSILCYVNDVTLGIFMNVFFIALWLIIAFASYNITKSRQGIGDFPVSMMLASWVTFITMILFRLIDCGEGNMLTSNIALAVGLILALISIFVLLSSRDQ